MKNERDVKRKVKLILEAAGAWYYMPVQTGYGVQGIPDFIVCLNGRFVAIETKFGKNTTSPLQARTLVAIHSKGGVTMVVNDKNVGELANALACIK